MFARPRRTVSRMIAFALAASMPVVGAGCTTTKPARDRAASVAASVAAYRQQQQDRVDRLNRQYRAAFSTLMDELARLYNDQATQAQSLDEQQLTDQMLMKWEEATLPRAFQDGFFGEVERQRARLAAARAAVDAARDAYADAYKEVTLDMAKLKNVEAGLDALAVPEDRLRVTADFIQTVARIYQQLRTEAEKNDAAKGSDTVTGNGGT